MTLGRFSDYEPPEAPPAPRREWKTVQVPRVCKCGRKHREIRTAIEHRWPRLVYVHGVGGYASVTDCSYAPYDRYYGRGKYRGTVQLYETPEEARVALTRIDEKWYGCGGGCTKRHSLVHYVWAD